MTQKIASKKDGTFDTTEQLLGFIPEESADIKLRLKLSNSMSKLRRERNITQAKLAELLNSSQSRTANIEAGSESVSIIYSFGHY